VTTGSDDGYVGDHTIYKWIVPWEKDASMPNE
jgi:hypothetical protein